MNRPYKSKHRHNKLSIISIVLVCGVIVFLAYQNIPSISSSFTTQNNLPQKIINQVKTQSKQIIGGLSQPITKDSITSQPTSEALRQSINNSPINISELEQQVHDLINQQRENNGLKALNFDTRLVTIAEAHSQDMITNNYFDHVDPQGLNVDGRYIKAGYPCYGWKGENIAQFGIDSQDNLANEVVIAWMNSPEHKQNILLPYYQNEGIGVVVSSNGIVYFTEDFC